AEQIGTFTVDCLPYTPNDKLQSCIQHNYVLHHSNFPQSSFSIAPSDCLRTSPRTVCDLGFDLILTKLSSGLTPDTAGKFELTGVEYRLRDFVVRVGTATQVTTTKGVIVEVEYEPSQVAAQSAHMMTEMMQMFFPQYYGQAPRSCSVLMYRDQSMLRHQCFCNSDWPGGVYATPTLAGGRDGGAVATAWATLLGKGRDGYITACHRVVETTRRLAELLSDIDGITLRGAADLCIVAFETTLGDIYVLVDFMTTKGWHVDPLLSPEAARVPVTLRMCEEGVLEAFVEDVLEGLRYLAENPTKTTKTSAFYHMLQTVIQYFLN
ncbi:hypothetical protein TELCIR_21523, partial [Teladorsagia circumcincta]